MELFSPEFFSALAAIVVIDLVLAGDNAIIIALAARNLPPHLQRKAIWFGTAGAIAVRAALTLIVVWLLGVPGLLFAGGLLLIPIAYRLLLMEQPGPEDNGKLAVHSFWSAMKTIIVADALMGLDNVLAVAGAAHGSFLLVVLGLLISVPIVIWGSTLILYWVQRYPAIIYLGSAVLAWTAAKMIVSEPYLATFFASHWTLPWATYALVITSVLGLGLTRNCRSARKSESAGIAMRAIATPARGE